MKCTFRIFAMSFVLFFFWFFGFMKDLNSKTVVYRFLFIHLALSQMCNRNEMEVLSTNIFYIFLFYDKNLNFCWEVDLWIWILKDYYFCLYSFIQIIQMVFCRKLVKGFGRNSLDGGTFMLINILKIVYSLWERVKKIF